MRPDSFPAHELLPHGPEMTLIDRLSESTDARSVGVVEITPETRFAGATGVPAFVGIEYMAQTIAARVGFLARLEGKPPPIGFLLGTRSYVSAIAEFPMGSSLRIIVEPLLVDAGFGSFQCRIEADSVLVSSILNTYQPSAEEVEAIRAAP